MKSEEAQCDSDLLRYRGEMTHIQVSSIATADQTDLQKDSAPQSGGERPWDSAQLHGR